ncbi:MAG: hypothetical protein E7316_07525 [Clostridiales bacterium]|nr:hypothetical protein [Clostridiales bacterium]
MFKRLIILLLAMVLSASSACAAEPAQALYLLVSRDAQGIDTPLGSAVLYQDGSTLLTTAWAVLHVGEGELYALGEGGALAVDSDNVHAFQEGIVLLTLETPSPAQPLGLNVTGSSTCALGHDAQGHPLCQEISAPAPIPYGDSAALLYSVPQAMLPGSVLVDETNALIGVTLAAYGEGVNRYMAIGSSQLPTSEKTTEWLTGFKLTLEWGFLTVDWSVCDFTCDQEDCVFAVIYTIKGNPYFSYLLSNGQESSIRFPAIPGETYQLRLQHAHGEPDYHAEYDVNDVETIAMFETPPFALYDYKDTDIYLSCAPAAEAESFQNTFLPPMEITAEALADENTAIFLQVSSSYTVEKNEVADLLLTLTTPEGYIFFTESGFIFDASLQEKDMWNIPVSDMLDDYLSFNATGVFAPGEYTLRYYLNGALANTFAWTLE